MDAAAWRDFGERRAQIYGYSFHYTKGGLYRVEDLPPWAEDLSARLVRDGLMSDPADQLIVNDYAPGQGIPAHVDAPLFTDHLGQSRFELRDGAHERGRRHQGAVPRADERTRDRRRIAP